MIQIYTRRMFSIAMREQLVEIKQNMPGYNPFFGSWVCQDDLIFLVDAGPANSAGRLIHSLQSLRLERIDFVLLTHIHIDHAGGLAELLNHYPMAKVLCHEKGINHLIAPSKLWEGSLKVLGDIARAYGPPSPIQRDRLIPHTECDIEDLLVIETPGHALHHLSFSLKNRLFAGEAGGNYFTVGDKEYLRPATPPRFFLDVCLKSVDRLLDLEDQPIRYAHFGAAESSHRMLSLFRDQLLRWDEIIRRLVTKSQGEDSGLVTRCVDLLLEEDSNLEAFKIMEPDVQKRERVFMGNAVKGFIGFITERR